MLELSRVDYQVTGTIGRTMREELPKICHLIEGELSGDMFMTEEAAQYNVNKELDRVLLKHYRRVMNIVTDCAFFVPVLKQVI